MNNQTVIYSDTNLTKNTKRQQMKSKDAKKSISISEQEITYADLTLHNASQNLQKNDKNGHCKGKLTAGILGVTCLVLMASIAIVKVINPGTGIQEKKVIQNLSSVHHCDHCPEDWFYYSNNCYFISSKKKSWTESKRACALKKSNLISMENYEEMKFMRSLSSVSWIGVSHESNNHPWLWPNGSTFNKNVRDPPDGIYNCVMLVSRGFHSDNCTNLKPYICKRKIQI